MAARMMTLIRVLLLGVAVGVAVSDQSEATKSSEEGLEDMNERKGRLDRPEVVLQLKYDQGELNRIYLAQFRQGKGVWSPSVKATNNLCTDLCHAGLGGAACGPTCETLMPVGLKGALTNVTFKESLVAESDQVYGTPRMDVCPSLCNNHLGQPLCNCASDDAGDMTVSWGAICSSFCVSDNYVLGGCPPCDEKAPPLHLAQFHTSRTLNTAEGWAAWCNVQCRQGHGGAACNCDRSPL